MRTTRMKKLALLLSLLALGALGLVACGGDDDDGSDESAAMTPATTTATARAAGTDFDHRVKLYTPASELRAERMAFEPRFHRHPDTATAEAGDLTIVWKNGGDPWHNICMEDEQGKPVFNQVVFNGGRERSAASTPPGHRRIRCSKTIRARTIRARAKVKPGEYTYYCSVGRHREDGMEGTLTVK